MNLRRMQYTPPPLKIMNKYIFDMEDDTLTFFYNDGRPMPRRNGATRITVTNFRYREIGGTLVGRADIDEKEYMKLRGIKIEDKKFTCMLSGSNVILNQWEIYGLASTISLKIEEGI